MKIDNRNDSIALGENAGTAFTINTTSNIAFGYEAGRYASTTVSDFNTYIGYQAGFNNVGQANNIFGHDAGHENIGSYNTSIGKEAGYTNTGSQNNLIGLSTGYGNKGSNNNFFGANTGYNNTGNYNEFFGTETGVNLQATNTVLIGSFALAGGAHTYGASNFQAVNNTVIGYSAGYAAASGASNNILIGYQAADNLTTGNNNIIIGYDINNVTDTSDNVLNIGNLIFGTNLDGIGTTIATGNIGIGTSTPSAKLDIWGDFRVGTSASSTLSINPASGQVLVSSGSATRPVLSFTTNSNTGIYSAAANQIGFTVSGTLKVVISSTAISNPQGGSGYFQINNNASGSSGSPTYAFQGYGSLGMYAPDSTTLAFSNSSERMRISNTGNVSVGTTTTNSRLTVAGTFTVTGTSTLATTSIFGNIGIGTSTPSAQLTTTGSVRFATFGAGTIQTDADGNLSVSSDERLKDIEGMYEAGLEEVIQLDPILYRWNKKSGLETASVYAGFSAQNVRDFLPEAVGEDSRGYFTLSDRAILAAVVNSIKEIWATVTGIEIDVTHLKFENAELKARLDVLEAKQGSDESVGGDDSSASDPVTQPEPETSPDSVETIIDEPDIPEDTVGEEEIPPITSAP